MKYQDNQLELLLNREYYLATETSSRDSSSAHEVI